MFSVYIRPLTSNDHSDLHMLGLELEIEHHDAEKCAGMVDKEGLEGLIHWKDKHFVIIVDTECVGIASLRDITAETANCSIQFGNKNVPVENIEDLLLPLLMRHSKYALGLHTLNSVVSVKSPDKLQIYEDHHFVHNGADATGLYIKLMANLRDMRPPAVSVITLIYNHEHFLSAALDSILSQKCGFDYCIVAGEDCSVDNSRAVLLGYAARFPGRFDLVLHDTNVGIFKNLEAVYKKCAGQYIALCDGDDYWIDNFKLHKQIGFLNSHADYTVAASVSLSQTGEDLQNAHNTTIDTTYELKDVLIKSRFEAVSFVFRNTAQLALPEWFFSQGGEIDALTLWMLKDGGKAYVFKEPMSVYRHHQGSMIRTTSAQKKVDFYLQMLGNFNESTNYKFITLTKKKEKAILAQFNLYLLPYSKRALFALKNLPSFFRDIPHMKLLIKYLLPLKYR